MSKVIQLRGGTSTEHSTFTGADREVTVDSTKRTLVLHDGTTPGGKKLANEDDIAAINTALDGKISTEAVTSLVLANNILTYTDEDGVAHDIPLTSYIDDTNLARITSGSVNASGIATFNRDDGTSFTINMSSFLDDTKLSDADIAAFGYQKSNLANVTQATIAGKGIAKSDLSNVAALPQALVDQVASSVGGVPTTFGAVGTYAFAKETLDTTVIARGGTIAGSNLMTVSFYEYASGGEPITYDTRYYEEGTLSGTWRNMGAATGSIWTDQWDHISLWLRIA